MPQATGDPATMHGWWWPLIFGAVVRVGALAPRPLWLDEALAVRVAADANPIAAIATRDLHPGLHALVLRGVLTLTDDPRWLRAPSFAASWLCVPVAAWAARRWGTSPLAAAWLAALSPPLVRYAAEARPYALGTLALFIWLGAIAPVAAARPGRPETATPHARHLLTAASAAVAATSLWGAWPVLAVQGALTGRLRALTPALLVTPWLILAAQLGAQASDLSAGTLARGFPDGAAWAVRQTLEVLGWLALGVSRHRAIAAGASLLTFGLAWARPSKGLTQIALAPAAAFLLLSVAQAHPWIGDRHLIVLLPGALLLATSAPRWPAVIGVVGLLTAPPLPEERLNHLDPDGALVDASLGECWMLLHPDRAALPWLAEPALPPLGAQVSWIWHDQRCVSCDSVPSQLLAMGYKPEPPTREGFVVSQTWSLSP